MCTHSVCVLEFPSLRLRLSSPPLLSSELWFLLCKGWKADGRWQMADGRYTPGTRDPWQPGGWFGERVGWYERVLFAPCIFLPSFDGLFGRFLFKN